MKLKDPQNYHSKKRQVDMIEKKLVSNAHSYGWSQIKTSRALLEGLLKVRIRFKSSKQLDVYRLVFSLNFKESDLKVFNPQAFDKEFILRSKEIDE
jgi:hypothetical protein